MKNNKLNIYLLIIILALTTLLILDKRFLPGKSPSPQFSRSNADLISTVMQLIKTDYLEEPNPFRTTEGAFRGLINSLDPLSSYLDKDLSARYLNRRPPVKNTGLVLYKKYGLFPVVVAVAENSPAAAAGIKVGDTISAINERNTLNMSLLEVNLLLEASSDQDEQPVKLRVVRNDNTLEFQIARNFTFPQGLKINTDKSGLLILKIPAINPDLSQEIKKSVAANLKKNGNNLKGLVLDLRECLGGEYEEAARVINLFLKAEEIGYFERRGQKEPVSCPENPAFPHLKLFVWVNQATFGPAEMIAGVLQEQKRAQVIGIETPGLVAKQQPFAINDGSLAVLTTAVFSLKSGTRLWEKSVPLDVKLTYSEKMDQTYLDKTRGLLSGAN